MKKWVRCIACRRFLNSLLLCTNPTCPRYCEGAEEDPGSDRTWEHDGEGKAG